MEETPKSINLCLTFPLSNYYIYIKKKKKEVTSYKYHNPTGQNMLIHTTK